MEILIGGPPWWSLWCKLCVSQTHIFSLSSHWLFIQWIKKSFHRKTFCPNPALPVQRWIQHDWVLQVLQLDLFSSPLTSDLQMKSRILNQICPNCCHWKIQRKTQQIRSLLVSRVVLFKTNNNSSVDLLLTALILSMWLRSILSRFFWYLLRLPDFIVVWMFNLPGKNFYSPINFT